MNKWKDLVDNVSSKDELSNFVKMLLQDLQRHPETWENPTLDRYLEALAGYIDDIDGFYSNMGKEFPKQVNWKIFAQILLSAKYYE